MQEIATGQKPPQTSQQLYEPMQKVFTPYDNPYPDNPLPPPPPPQKPPRSRKRLWLIIGIVVAILVLGIVGGSIAIKLGPKASTPPTTQPTQQITSSPTQPPVTQPTQPPVTQPSQTNTIGKPVQVGDTWVVTVNSVKPHGGSGYSQPMSGNTYLIVDVTLKNISSRNQFTTSMGMFSLRDQTGLLYKQVFPDFAKPSPDNMVSPGSLLRGEIVYEVPSSIHTFTFSFVPSLSTGVMAEWNVKV